MNYSFNTSKHENFSLFCGFIDRLPGKEYQIVLVETSLSDENVFLIFVFRKQ